MAQKGRGDRVFNIPSETSASGLGSHLVGCAQRIVPLLRRAGGGSGENLEKIADARLNSQPGPHPFFTLVSKWVFRPLEGKCPGRVGWWL